MKGHGLRVIQGGGFRQRRKATKIERLKAELAIAKLGNAELITRLKISLIALKEFENEANWCLTGTAKPEDEAITWVGEGEPPIIAKAALARIRGATTAFDAQVEDLGEVKVLEKGEKVEIAQEEKKIEEDTMPPEEKKGPFVVFGPDSHPAGGMVKKEGIVPDDGEPLD